MITKETVWTVDDKFFRTQTEAINFIKLRNRLADVTYRYGRFESGYDFESGASVAVSPSLVVTLVSYFIPIDMGKLPDGFTLTEDDTIQEAHYQATSIKDAIKMANTLYKDIQTFIKLKEYTT